MRAAPLVLLLVAPMAAAQGGQLVERDGWTQFVPEWREGPARPQFRGAAHDVPSGVAYATDGETWFYATNATAAERDEPPSCGPGDGRTYVLLTPRSCTLVPHPGFACSGTTVCGPAHAVPSVATYPLDTCGRVQGAYCTPAPALGGVLLLVVGAALTAPSSARGRA